MFSYLRYFSIISALVVIITAAILGYYFRGSASESLRELVTTNNQVLVQGFINNVWKDHDFVKMMGLFRQHDIPRNEWYKFRGFKENSAKFTKESFQYFESMPVVQVNLYNPQGEVLLSLTQSSILEDRNKGVKVAEIGIDKAQTRQGLRGEIASAILEAREFQKPDGRNTSGVLVQTVMPIFSDQYVPLVNNPEFGKKNNLQGAVEIYYDITEKWESVYYFQYIITAAIITIFLVLIGALTIVASKAEAIISRQHEANLELAAQAAAAETENENKSQFLASISHELRTPLNAIIGFSEIIRNEVMGKIAIPQYRDYIRDIHNSGVHLLSLINDILDYSKAEAGKLDVQIDEANLTKIVHASMRLIAPRAEEAQVALSKEIPEKHFITVTDSKKFKQVMLNLLSNAVKFTPPGGEVKVTMWQNIVEDRIGIEVRDNGIGIAPKDISKALAPFGQVDSALSRKYEGTGLGLPLTKKFIEIMGGTFAIESQEGEGTVITFSLPINSSEDEPS